MKMFEKIEDFRKELDALWEADSIVEIYEQAMESLEFPPAVNVFEAINE